MIGILSQDFETTTDLVCDWLAFYGHTFLRINGETLVANPLSIRLDETVEHTYPALESITAIWYRRWYNYSFWEQLSSIDHPKLFSDVNHQVASEFNATSAAFMNLLPPVPWLSKKRRVSKPQVLTLAREIGLDIPKSLMTSEKVVLLDFVKECEGVITKPLSESSFFEDDTHAYAIYTEQLDTDTVNKLPNQFFPSFFQEKVEKAFEVRSFYLDGDCHSMAIFSQNDEQTAVDFRKYNKKVPNRNVPYILPARIEQKLVRLMQELGLDTGSIDIVVTPDDRHVFLEVNPVGQFGMVSAPCNYYLEEKVAKHLIKLSKQ